MSISNYTDLQAAVTTWLDDDSLPADDFIALAEAELFLDLMAFESRPRILEASATGTISGNLAIPSNFFAVKSFSVVSGGERLSLEPLDSSRVDRYVATGRPLGYCLTATEFQFGPPPDGSYSYTLRYYAKPAPLATTATNALLTDHPNLYLFGALKQAEPYLAGDERIALWQNLYNQYLGKLELAGAMEKHSGRSPRMRGDSGY